MIERTNDSVNRFDGAPIVIGGSHLQALILAATAVVIVVVWRDDVIGWPLPSAIVLFGAAAAIAYRRCVLEATAITYRRLGRTVVAPAGAFRADLGHRYLAVETIGGSSFRIEVPVEIRPNVRDWVEATAEAPPTE